MIAQKLSERYRPQTLADVTGQPATFYLKQLAANPRPCCVLLEGSPGTGKTTSAYALAHDLGCEDEYSGIWMINAVNLTIDTLRDLFENKLRLRPLSGSGWNVLILEELEALPSVQVQRALKTYLESNLRWMKCIVVATSNGAGGLSSALLERFKILCFPGSPTLHGEARQRIGAIWRKEAGDAPLPAGWLNWGVVEEDGLTRFSFRRALDELEDALLMTGVGA
jgi:replication-associated recombination protein RarA